MGEWKVQVPMKLPAWLVDRLDRDVQEFGPFCEGRSAVGRELLIYAYSLIDAGIIEWSQEAIKGVRSNSRNGNQVPSVLSKPIVPELKKRMR